ncbi:lipid-A-disaccharide synthase [uncultured Brachyspira sp.]|uniref:lipid-A-disaccharide synthase n=1 Tax=uncultured Brachyspira sp. TaxID=221953 RepID=UPI002604527C|nr:lipid-A-disaccharide synthase [uncultured Brachyspira sp.]
MRIFIATGEVSGDIQGALLAKKIKELDSSIILDGFGGVEMQKADVNILSDMSTLSTMGIFEGANPVYAFKKLGAFNILQDYLKKNKVDIMLLVDNQGVNLLLAKYFKANNIPYIYYFPPHVGIWGAWNAKKLLSAKKIITPFLFDYDVYKKYGCNVMYSGHPFADLDYNREIPKLDMPEKDYTVGVLFGSRHQEITKLAPVFIKAMKMLNDMLSSNIRFVIPIAYPEYTEPIKKIIDNYKNILEGVSYSLLNGENKDYVYSYSDALIMSSGTASLLAACYGKPMVICYKISHITFLLGKLLTNIKYVGMPNVLLNEEAVPELLQNDCNPNTITSYIMKYLTDKEYYKKVSTNLLRVRDTLGEKNVLERIAKEIIKS